MTKIFEKGDVLAVDNVSLKIKDGEYTFLLGPSGCGKTTTLRIIAGLEMPTNGQILINNKDMKGVAPENRDMGFVFQNFEIFQHMTVWENVAFGLEMRGYSNEIIEKKTRSALEKVGLEKYSDDFPSIFGNPGLQKLGIARAIGTGAKILIMDEPLGSLDPKVSQVFRHEIRELIKKLGLTAIQVTHNQEEAMSVADKIIVMRNGNILQMGTPYKLYENPKSIFVANFLGETNFLEGFVLKVYDNAMKVWIRMGGPKIYCNNFNQKFLLDDNVVVGFRYEDVYLFPIDYDFEESKYDWYKMNFFKAKLNSIRFIGATKRYYLELETGENFTAIKSGSFKDDFDSGDEVFIGVHQNDIHVFKTPEDLLYELSLY